MSKLPFVIPDRDLSLNLGLALLIFENLGLSARGIPLLNNERISVFFYLIKNPTILKKTLQRYGQRNVVLHENEAASVNSISINLDSLFDRNWTKAIIKHLIARELIETTYRPKEGFLYRLSREGVRVAASLHSEHFERVRYFLLQLNSLKSESTSNINKMLNQSFREE